jgi:hypothetical protein
VQRSTELHARLHSSHSPCPLWVNPLSFNFSFFHFSFFQVFCVSSNARRGQCLVDAAVFEAVPFRSAIADGCTHLLVLCTRPARRRRSRVNAALADAMEVAIKKAVLSPDYMVPAWKAEVDCLAQDGLSQDEMLLAAADREDAHELPWFAGAHVYPLYPGAAAK